MNRAQLLALRLAGIRRGPIVCRKCGATLGYALPALRDGRVHLRDFDEIAPSPAAEEPEAPDVRVRWTAEDELAFEHVRDSECERR